MFNPEQSKKLKVLSIILLSSFIIFLIGVAVSIYFIFILPMNKGKTDATITKITNNSTTVIYNGRRYEKRYSVYSSSYYVGKKIKIYYNKQKPFDSSIANMRFISLVGPGIGIIFLGISGLFCLVFYKKNIDM